MIASTYDIQSLSLFGSYAKNEADDKNCEIIKIDVETNSTEVENTEVTETTEE